MVISIAILLVLAVGIAIHCKGKDKRKLPVDVTWGDSTPRPDADDDR